jgi:surface antigen
MTMKAISRKMGLALTAVALPLMLAAPVEAHGYYGPRGWGHSNHVTVIHRYSYHRGGGDGLALGLLGLGAGVIIGSAITQNSAPTTVVQQPPVVYQSAPQGYYAAPVAAAPVTGNGWYQPVAQAAPAQGSCMQTREYQTKVLVGGQSVDAYGTACLQPDGSWQFGAPTPVPR